MKGNKSEQCFNGIKCKWRNLSNSYWYTSTDQDHHTDMPPVLLFTHISINPNTHFYQYDNRSSTLWSVLMWLHGSTARLLIIKKHTCALKSGWEKTTSQGHLLRMKWKQTKKGGKLGKNKIHRLTLCTVFS